MFEVRYDVLDILWIDGEQCQGVVLAGMSVHEGNRIKRHGKVFSDGFCNCCKVCVKGISYVERVGNSAGRCFLFCICVWRQEL